MRRDGEGLQKRLDLEQDDGREGEESRHIINYPPPPPPPIFTITDYSDFEGFSPYDVADMIKLYFRELPEPILTGKLSEMLIMLQQCEWREFNMEGYNHMTRACAWCEA